MDRDDFQRALFRVEQVRAIEQVAIAAGTDAAQLMQRAAGAARNALLERWPQLRSCNLLVGPGDNGGDALWLAALLRECGVATRACLLVADAPRSAAATQALALARARGVELLAQPATLPPAELQVDGLFGIGLARAPQGLAAQWITQLNDAATPVLALDVPSGLDADRGSVPGVAVRATATISFVAWKRGLHTGRARACCGALQLDTLGLDDAAVPAADAWLLAPTRWPARARDAHKGSYGHVLVIGGAPGYAGAARLAGEAALRCGAGLVSVATAAPHAGTLGIGRPELMVHACADAAALPALLERATALALGPGLGRTAWSRDLLQAALASDKPLLLDADALNLLSEDAALRVPSGAVLTPHPGEAARLLGCSVADVEHDRYAAARALAARHAAVVVLKGAGTLIADTTGRVAVCAAGNPGMASGGMGDLLSGVIAALRAQGMDAWQAACAGVDLHARAGDAAAARGGERGLLAGDLLPELRRLCNE